MWRFFLGLPLDLLRLLKPAADAALSFALRAGARFVCGLILVPIVALSCAVDGIRWFAGSGLKSGELPPGLMVARMLAGGGLAGLLAVWVFGYDCGSEERLLALMIGQCGSVLGLLSIIIQDTVRGRA